MRRFKRQSDNTIRNEFGRSPSQACPRHAHERPQIPTAPSPESIDPNTKVQMDMLIRRIIFMKTRQASRSRIKPHQARILVILRITRFLLFYLKQLVYPSRVIRNQKPRQVFTAVCYIFHSFILWDAWEWRTLAKCGPGLESRRIRPNLTPF